MSAPILRLHWLQLKRDRTALVLSFVLPIVFFSVFTAMYLEIAGNGAPPALRVGILDLDRSALSRQLVSGLQAHSRLDAQEISDAQAGGDAARHRLVRLVRGGSVPVALVLPAGFGATLGSLEGAPATIEVLEDRSDAPQVAAFRAILQASLMRVVLESWAVSSMEELRASGVLQGATHAAELPAPAEIAASMSAARDRVRVVHVDALGPAAGGHKSAAVAYFAAGTGVLFLLFTMAGASATLLDEAADGTLQRLLASGLGIGRLLLYKWLFFATLGAAQVCVMFAWGWAVFGLELFTAAHFSGFVVMTALTALAAAALGIALAVACASRAQFTGLSTILILVMSALGGSMFPRFLMSDGLKTVGLATFNAWALDGYQKVFWYETPLAQLWPQALVLALAAALLMAAARLMAARRFVE